MVEVLEVVEVVVDGAVVEGQVEVVGEDVGAIKVVGPAVVEGSAVGVDSGSAIGAAGPSVVAEERETTTPSAVASAIWDSVTAEVVDETT